MVEEGPLSAAPATFAVLLVLHVFLRIYSSRAPGSRLSPQESELMQEIRKLHQTANAHSSPDTFAKAAKLKRVAAAKEKELAQLSQKLEVQKSWQSRFHSSFPYALKVGVYILLAQWFWHTSVATMPRPLLRPFEHWLYTGNSDSSSEELVAVGIVPWIVISSQVSNYFAKKVVWKPR